MRSYPWMRWMPGLKNRRCSDCGREYARWLGCFALRHGTARGMVLCWVCAWLVGFAIGFGLGVAWLMTWKLAQIG